MYSISTINVKRNHLVLDYSYPQETKIEFLGRHPNFYKTRCKTSRGFAVASKGTYDGTKYSYDSGKWCGPWAVLIDYINKTST